MDALTEIWLQGYHKYKLSTDPDYMLTSLSSKQQIILQEQSRISRLLQHMGQMVENAQASLAQQAETGMGPPKDHGPKMKRLKCVQMKRAAEMNLYAAMNGYDLPISNPYDKGGDPAIRSRIFLHDCYHDSKLTVYSAFKEPGYYNFVSDVRTSMRCDADSSVKSYTNEKEYNKAHTDSNIATDYSKEGGGK